MESPLSATLPLSQTSNSEAGDGPSGGRWMAALLRSDDGGDDNGDEDAYDGLLVESLAMDGAGDEDEDDVPVQQYYGNTAAAARKFPLKEEPKPSRSDAMEQRLRRLVADEDCQDPAFYSMALHALGGKGEDEDDYASLSDGSASGASGARDRTTRRCQLDAPGAKEARGGARSHADVKQIKVKGSEHMPAHTWVRSMATAAFTAIKGIQRLNDVARMTLEDVAYADGTIKHRVEIEFDTATSIR